jgi:O-antigen ligase
MFSQLINNKIIRNTSLFIILTEALSFLGYYYQIINSIAFFAIAILVLVLSLYRLEYGLFILLTELLIGSFGYLFYFETGGFKISIRIALWLIIMSVWLAKEIIKIIKTKKIELDFFRSSYLFYFLALFIFIVFGMINGFLKNNSLNNIFFDSNNWFYFSLIFPIFSVLKNDDNIKIVKQIFLTSIGWLSIKTIILAYIFSHSFNFFALDLYLWVRRSGVGEITQVVPGFNRIFMQSHIFILIGFFILLFYLLKNLKEKSIALNKQNFSLIIFSALLLSVIIISFSRSFWLGLVAGAIFIYLIAIFKIKIGLKKFVIFNLISVSIIILSLALTLIIVKFPYPAPAGEFDATNLFSERATQIAGEAGVSSRWQLLPELWQKIKTAPVLGRGFGATVTYKSNDPRVLATNYGGEYTTYAFEWGWLDIWLKIGILGLLAYLILFTKIIFDGLKINSFFSFSLATGLILILAVNMFSPYANHPLGIGYLIIAAIMIEKLKTPLR